MPSAVYAIVAMTLEAAKSDMDEARLDEEPGPVVKLPSPC
jgi:hypothetical protein